MQEEKKYLLLERIYSVSIFCLAACIRCGCLNTFSAYCMSWRNDNRCQLNRENLNAFHKFSYFVLKDLWFVGGTVPPQHNSTQHKLSSSSCEHLLFCALHCGKSLYITETPVSISLVWVYFPPFFLCEIYTRNVLGLICFESLIERILIF